ncbi:MAG: hypothetical protein J0M02_18840, partial [Planctomycetes bacterium]|nr:hypothetical protein [Planctomycetota bacterium]
AQPLAEALRGLGPAWLRYPGGEKSDFHRFAPPPYAAPAPYALGWYATVPGAKLDFDAYLRLCRATRAEPYVVVACDSPARTGASWDEQLQHAVAWVRYAAGTAGPRVRRWEIGNENWHNGTAAPAEMAAQVVRFARAMKAADPSILVGASGNDATWWTAFLPAAAADLDFLSVSVYNCWQWRGYDRLLRLPEPDLLGAAGTALAAIDALPDARTRQRLQVVVAETNSVDYSEGGWSRSNDLGHAIVTFESLGAMLRQPRIAAAMLWNTRWIDDAEAQRDQFYAFDAANRPTPAGMAVALWGRHLRSRLVAVEGGGPGLRVHASQDGSGTSLWLVNRTPDAVAGITCRLAGRLRAWCFTGSGPTDTAPTLTELATPDHDSAGSITLTCPATSITVLRADLSTR